MANSPPPALSFPDVFLGCLVALAAGALIGLEREQSRTRGGRPSPGGARSFPLIALSGALAGLLTRVLGGWIVGATLLAVGTFLAVAYYQEWSRTGAPGIATEVAAVVTYLLGAVALLPDLPLSTAQRYLLIVASAAVVMALLSFKTPLHRAAEQVSDDDLYATAKFVILALVLLPLLPDRPMGPLEVLNPFDIGLMIVLVAAISYLAYVATRTAGPRRGLAVTGVLGGLVSSTAVTVSMAPRARDAAAVPAAATAILVASATMFARMLVIVGLVDPPLLRTLAWPLAILAAAGYAAAAAVSRRAPREPAEGTAIEHRNPFELGAALKFGLLYAGVILGAKAAQTLFGETGLYLSSLLAGTTDVDAITLSLSRFHRTGLDPETATAAIVLAAATNTAVKAGIAAWLGGPALARIVVPALAAVLGAGALALLL